MQQKTNPKGTIIVNVNATDIFSSYEDEYDEPGFPAIEVSGMSMSQSIEAPLTLKDTAILNGTLSLSNGVGNGAFVICARRLINKGWLSLELGAGNGPLIGLKGSRTLTDRIFCNGGLTLSIRPNMILPGFVGSKLKDIFGRLESNWFLTFISATAIQLDKHTVGYLTYNAGIVSSLATVIERNTENYHANLTVLVGIPHSYFSTSYMRKFPNQELKLRGSVK